jgi:N-acetylglucosaminyldiphosphoundecaprenol N-acetyl-beta-D-mannosaminyltransferase
MTIAPNPPAPPAPPSLPLAREAVAAAEALAAAPTPRPAHVPVGPLSVFNGDLAMTVDLCRDAIRAGRGLRVATANLDFVARARRDAVLRADLDRSSIVVADGAPVAWLARLSGGRNVRRVAGVDLVGALCEAGGEGLRVAIYGSDDLTTAAASARLERDYPGAEVVVRVCPPFRQQTRAEVDADLARLADARPQVVFVALGCPRQERFIAAHFHAIPGAVWVGVGGTFDFYAGRRKRAPKLLQAAGAEWVTRLIQEPRRLWRRYLVDDLPHVVRLAPSAIRRRHRTRVGEVEELRRSLLGAA